MNNDFLNNDCENEENQPGETSCQENDIGIVAVANAPYNIHCLTVIGQVVIIDRVKYSTRFPCRSPF